MRKNPFQNNGDEDFDLNYLFGSEQLLELEAIYVAQAEQMAKLMRIYFEALADAGFTEEQALEIIIAHGGILGGKE